MITATRILLNPQAYRHRTGRLWQTCQRECLRQLSPAEVTVVESAAEAEAATHDSALAGFGRFVGVGGPEVAHGIVNGVMRLAPAHRREVAVGFLSVATQADWQRTVDFPRAVARQIEILRAGHTLPFDIGRVECRDDRGRPVTRYFLNGAGFGLPAAMRRTLRDRPGGLVRSAEGTLRAALRLLANRGPQVVLAVDGRVVYEGPWSLGLVMVGRYYRGLGRVAPDADPTDGALDVLWVGNHSAPRVWRQLSALVTRHLRGGAQGTLRGATVRVDSPAGEVLLEADGQPVGRLPAQIAVEPRALPMIVEPVAVRWRQPAREMIAELGRGRPAGTMRAGCGPAWRGEPPPGQGEAWPGITCG